MKIKNILFIVLLGVLAFNGCGGSGGGVGPVITESPGNSVSPNISISPDSSMSGNSMWNRISTIIFSDNFNNSPTGIYNLNQLVSEWNNPSGQDGIAVGRVSVIADSNAYNGKSLRVFYPAGKIGANDSGAVWKLKLGRVYNKLYCSYWVKFSPNFNFVKEGKLPGLAGGVANSGGVKPNGTDGWSARILWRSGGAAAQYVYYPDQAGVYGDIIYWNSNSQKYFIPGQWHHLENLIIMNTPGRKDGEILARFDGTPALDKTGIRFRSTNSLGIDIFCFSTFFGGDDSSFASTKDVYAYFDDFLICEVK